RGRVPLGLLYGTYCPPHIRVAKPAANGSSVASSIVEAERQGGLALGSALDTPTAMSERLAPLPVEPYRSLAQYESEHRALFAGRDAEVRGFAVVRGEPGTRAVILHGGSGVGKSSFLRAGLIPYLEEECIGYRFVRGKRKDGGRSPVLFVRATHDLPGQ